MLGEPYRAGIICVKYLVILSYYYAVLFITRAQPLVCIKVNIKKTLHTGCAARWLPHNSASFTH